MYGGVPEASRPAPATAPAPASPAPALPAPALPAPASPTPALPAPALPAPALPAPVVSPRAHAASLSSSPRAPEHDRSLGAERALLDQARAALARRDGAAAARVLGQHARRFPAARLAEEREVMWIQALALAGDHAQARARGERFRRDHARSAFAPVVDEVLRTIP